MKLPGWSTSREKDRSVRLGKPGNRWSAVGPSAVKKVVDFLSRISHNKVSKRHKAPLKDSPVRLARVYSTEQVDECELLACPVGKGLFLQRITEGREPLCKRKTSF